MQWMASAGGTNPKLTRSIGIVLGKSRDMNVAARGAFAAATV